MEKQYKETWLVGGRSYNINELDDVCTVTAIGQYTFRHATLV